MEITPSSEAEPRIESITSASVSDQPTNRDSLGFEPYVAAIARFLLNSDTRPPLTLSVEGEWGSGKSSFMRQLKERLESSVSGVDSNDLKRLNVRTVWFNAWRHDKSDALWAAFALGFIDQISRKMSLWERINAAWELTKKRFDWKSGWWDVCRFLFVSLAWITLTVSGLYLWLLGAISIKGLLNGKALFSWGNELLTWGIASGGIFSVCAATFFMFKQATSMLGNPLKYELKKHLKAVDYAEKVAFIEKFHRDFAKIVRAYVGDAKIFVFIDDLDRCDIPTSTELMQALNLMIAEENPIIFIIGMDREKVAGGLAAKHKDLLPYLIKNGSYGLSNDRNDADAIEYGFSFIEKFIQLPFRVPTPGPENLYAFLRDLRGTIENENVSIGGNIIEKPLKNESNEQQKIKPEKLNLADQKSKNEDFGGRQWDAFELRVANDSDTINQVVEMVAPALDYNPRKLKQFINVFRLRSYICFDTGLFNPVSSDHEKLPLTFERLAKIIAISLRWPIILNDLENDSLLLTKLINDKAVETAVITRWRNRRQLVELIRFNGFTNHAETQSEVEMHNFSLVGFDVEQLMRVWPAVKRPAKTDGLEVKESEGNILTTDLGAEDNDGQTKTKKNSFGFLSNNKIREIVLDSGSLKSNERILGSLILFKTEKQQTWLLCTSLRIFILLDDEVTRESENVIRTWFDKAEIFPLKFDKDREEGTVKFGLREASWYYSVHLFPTADHLRLAIEKLVNDGGDEEKWWPA